MYLRTVESFMSANRKKIGFANPQRVTFAEGPQIRKGSHLRKVRKTNKVFSSTNLRICDLRNLFADRPTLKLRQICRNHLNTTN
jgi:hypothetical protein